jgi:hypothetical protein
LTILPLSKLQLVQLEQAFPLFFPRLPPFLDGGASRHAADAA